MSVLDHYSTGTVTVTNGETGFTLSGGDLELAGIMPGDTLIIPGFPAVTIDDVTDSTTGTLLWPWPHATQTNVAYFIFRTALDRFSGLYQAEQQRDLNARIRDAVVYRVTGLAPDPGIGAEDSLALRVAGTTLQLWVKEAGDWGDPISLVPTFGNNTAILDPNANELLQFGVVAAATNHFKVTNAATGGVPLLSVIGDDANISARYATKGTGLHIWTINGIDELRLSATALFPHSSGGLDLGTLANPFAVANVGTMIVTGAAGTYRLFRFASGASGRWDIGISNEAEAGGNVGSNFFIHPLDDAGAGLGFVLSIDRSTGQVRYHRTNDATSLTDGPARFDGGLSVAKTIVALSQRITATTPASSTTTGALQVAGGVGIGGNAHVGGDLFHAGGHGVRPKLTANRTYYVRSDGSDANNGLSNTSGGAFATIGKAIDTAYALDWSTYRVTIQLADGTYVLTKNISGAFVSISSLLIRGNPSNPSAVVITSTGNGLRLADGASVEMTGVTLQAGGFCAIGPISGGSFRLGANCRFTGAPTFGWIYCAGGYADLQSTSFEVAPDAPINCVLRCDGGLIDFRGGASTVTLTGSVTLLSGFVSSSIGGRILIPGRTFAGAATGPRYQVYSNGVIFTNGGGASYFPGDAAGAASTGGQYV